MIANEKLISVLIDLVAVNNDRMNGYKKAAEESISLDKDLQSIFNNMANDSRRYAAELMEDVTRAGGVPSTAHTEKGKIYRAWIDIRATFSGHDRQAILESCEFADDAVQKAYNEAIASDAEMDDKTRKLITDQKSYLKTAHKLIRNYRDAHWKMAPEHAV